MGWILIALLTLFPYQILPEETVSSRQDPFLLWFFEKYPDGFDVFLNILLFAPFALGVGWRLDKWKVRWPVALLLTCAASGTFSFWIELAQKFMPTRTSSWFDVLANTAGGALGWILFRMFGRRIGQSLSFMLDKLLRIITRKALVAAFIAYAALWTLISIPLSREIMLGNWDLSYPLVIGNVPNGEYPWHGQILQFKLADRALSASEAPDALQSGLTSVPKADLLASYEGGAQTSTSSETGSFPPLHWTPQGITDTGLRRGLLPGLGWMQTEGAATEIERRIRDSNQFSAYLVFAPIRTSSYGPAWMMTLAPNAEELNLGIGQQLSHLVVRTRTPLTGTQGQPPEYRIQDFFLTTGAHRLLVTYDGATLRSYTDGRRGYAMELGPGAALFSRWRALRQFETPGYKALYYGLIFVPLGFLLALMARIFPHPSAMASACSLLIPSAILEPVLAGVSHRPLCPVNVLLGIGLSSASFFFLRRYLPR